MKQLLLISLGLVLSLSVFAQKKSEKLETLNSQQINDSITAIYNSYEEDRQLINNQLGQMVDTVAVESMLRQWDLLERQCNNETFNFCCKYLPTSDEIIEYIYKLRTTVGKANVQAAYGLIKGKQRKHPYAELLQTYLNSRQANLGEQMMDFSATTYDGKTFNLKEITATKTAILIFGGAGAESLEWLKMLNKDVNRDKMDIIYFSTTAQNEQELINEREQNGMEWNVVSDFKGDKSLASMAYDVQATPTFVVVDTTGKVIYWSVADASGVIGMIAKN